MIYCLLFFGMSQDRTLPKQIIRKEEILNATDSENTDYKDHFGLYIFIDMF